MIRYTLEETSGAGVFGIRDTCIFSNREGGGVQVLPLSGRGVLQW